MRSPPSRLTAVLALLAAAAARAEAKFGYVDLQRALNEIDEGKAAKARSSRTSTRSRSSSTTKQVEFDKLRQDFEKQAVVMAEQARRDKAGGARPQGRTICRSSSGSSRRISPSASAR